MQSNKGHDTTDDCGSTGPRRNAINATDALYCERSYHKERIHLFYLHNLKGIVAFYRPNK